MVHKILILAAFCGMCNGCTHLSTVGSDQDPAAVAAILEVLHRTTIPDRLAESCGAIFFEGVSTITLDAIVALSQNKLPRLDTDLRLLDRPSYIDKATGRQAIFLKIRTIHKTASTRTLRIAKEFGSLGEAICVVVVRRTNGQWNVIDFRIDSVS